MNKKNRIGYIDTLRGGTMILVVLGHVASIYVSSDDNFSQFFLTFRMPLFFFISGFIGYKGVEMFTKEFYFKRMKLKSFVQIVPVSIFILLCCSFTSETFSNLYNHSWGGWWFTYCLFEMFTIYYSVSFLCNLLNARKLLFPILISFSVMGVAYLSFGKREGLLYSPLIIESLTKYFQWFVMGLLVKRHFNKIESAISRNYNAIITGSIILLVILFWVSQESKVPYVIHKFVHDIAVRYAGLICVFLIFFSYRDYFEKSGTFQNCIKFVGRRTLDIYLIHNFLLPNMSFMRPILEGRLLLEIVFYLCTSLIIVTVCLGVSQIIRRSNTLAYWCFGSKNKSSE